MSKKAIFNNTHLDLTITGVQVRKSFSEIFLILLSWLIKITSYAFGIIVLIYVIFVLLPFIQDAEKFTFLNQVEKFGKLSTDFLRRYIPTKISGQDVAIYILIIGTLILKSSLRRTSENLFDRSNLVYFKRKYEAWKNQQHIKKGSAVTNQLDQKLFDLEKAKPRDREEILKQFIETKKKLDAMGRDLAFLSIDVVDSTKMKVGEEKAFIEHDFKEFKRFVEGVLVGNGALKQAWTPDGVMTCFERVDQAVMAGRQVIIGLEAFNKNIKAMRNDFAVRCGVNSGFVYYDESLPLEEIADRVIDIAGHFQKHAKPNTIWITKLSIEPLATRDGFQPTTEVVDGYEVYEWKKD